MDPHLQRLIWTLINEGPAQAENAIRAIGQLRSNGKPALQPLLKKLQIAQSQQVSDSPEGKSSGDLMSETQARELEYWIVWALGRIGTAATEALPALNRISSHRDMRIRVQAQEAIDRIEGRWQEGQWRV